MNVGFSIVTDKYWTTGVRSPAGANDLSVSFRVQTGSGAHSALYTVGTSGKAQA